MKCTIQYIPHTIFHSIKISFHRASCFLPYCQIPHSRDCLSKHSPTSNSERVNQISIESHFAKIINLSRSLSIQSPPNQKRDCRTFFSLLTLRVHNLFKITMLRVYSNCNSCTSLGVFRGMPLVVELKCALGLERGSMRNYPPWFPAEVTSPPRIKAADAIGSDSGVRSGDPRVRAGLGNPSLWR